MTIWEGNEPPATPLDTFYADPERTTWRPFGAAPVLFVQAVWGAVLRHRWDLIFADQVGVASTLYPLRRAGLCSYVVSCNGLELSPTLLGLRRRLGLFGAHRCLAISPTTRDKLLAMFPRLSVVVYQLRLDPKLPELAPHPAGARGVRRPPDGCRPHPGHRPHDAVAQALGAGDRASGRRTVGPRHTPTRERWHVWRKDGPDS